MRLFDEDALRKLESLTLNAESVRVGVMKGNRRSRKRGASIEFADYRDYAPGDDLRRLDWNVYARLERPLIKLTEEEEDLAVHILIDVSSSMDWPPGEEGEATNKLRFAMRLAGGLGYIGLLAGDLVHVTLLDGDSPRSWGPFRGRQNAWPMLRFLEANYESLFDANRARPTILDPSLHAYAQRARRPGLLFLLSDLLTPEDFRPGLNSLLSRGYEIVLLHLLSPDELTPELAGDLKLIDAETNRPAEVTLDAQALEAYADNLERWQADIAGFSRPRGIHYAPISTGTAWERVIGDALSREGVVR